ncbi:AMP-binding protein [Anaerotruncus colihominis]|uniref:AMP-binding protein n=2 Tax=Anaerotruncus colihominis TaxID=169435 RepID=UPI001897EFC6|nr:AMP-binding protein [Anaerotruncus colihominis]
MIFGIDERDPRLPAAYQEDREICSYGRLCADAARIAALMPGRPLVFQLCENSYGALCGYAGLLSGGAVPLLLDAGMRRELLSGLLETYRPGFLWLPERMAVDFPKARRLLSLAEYVLLGTGEAPPRIHPDLAPLLTTSGSTGSPKLVRQSRRNIESNARAIARYLEIGEGERAVTTLPMNYTYGLSIIQSHLIAGASVVLTSRSVMETGFWGLFRELEATNFGGVPYTYEILQRIGFFDMELPSLRFFTQAGGKLPRALHERGGVLLTGDMAMRDGDGCYAIVGRKKRFIKLFGSRVSLDGCERLVKAQFPGVDCARFGKDDALCLCVTDPNLLENAAQRLAELLGVHRRAVSARYAPEIPRSSAGKTLYRELEGLL